MKHLLALLSVFVLSMSQAKAQENWSTIPPVDHYTVEHRFIFFAVLEGLYNDGVSDEVVKAIMGKSMYDNFIYACPVCHPSYEAFRLYSQKQAFFGQKGTEYKFFGQGLERSIRNNLQEGGDIRRKQIKKLIQKWIFARLDKSDIEGKEREVLLKHLAEMKKKGNRILESYKSGSNGKWLQEHYKDVDSCPFCDGAALDIKNYKLLKETAPTK